MSFLLLKVGCIFFSKVSQRNLIQLLSDILQCLPLGQARCSERGTYEKGGKRMRSGNSVKINGGLSAHTGFTSNLLHRQSQIHVHTHTWMHTHTHTRMQNAHFDNLFAYHFDILLQLLYALCRHDFFFFTVSSEYGV